MTGGQELALTIAIAVACWLAGRLAVPRIAPWRRMSVGITVLVLAVVLLISLNYSLELLPRGVLRLALMFGAFGWVLGIFGYRDGRPPKE